MSDCSMASPRNQTHAPAASLHPFPSLPPLPAAPVSGSKESKSTQLRAGSWAHSVRQRINRQLKEDGKPMRQDVDLLTAELINVFVTTLQKNSRGSWLYLQEVFHLLRPYRDHLRSREELLPYLENVYYQYQSNQALLSDLDILGAMDKAFPKDSSVLYHRPHHPRARRKGPPQLQPLTEEFHAAPNPAFSGQPYPFVLERDHCRSENVFRPAPVSLQDLSRGVSVVGAELAQGEALWRSNLGTTSLAFRTDLPVEFQPMEETEVERSVADVEQHKPPAEEKHKKPGPPEHRPITGKMAAELFVQHRHLGKINFLYLNIAPSRHFSWLRNVNHLHLVKKQEALGCQLLIAVPHFGASLQHISRLLQELHTIHWLPLGQSHCFSFADLQEAFIHENQEAKGQLSKFLALCTTILELVRRDSFKMVEILQKQLENSKPAVLKDSVYLHKTQQTSLERRLHQAESWLNRLGNLAFLVDHMIEQNLLTIVQEEITTFVQNILQTAVPGREAFLEVSLHFDAQSQLIMVPCPLELEELFSKALDTVVTSVVQVVQSWDEMPKEGSEEQTRTVTPAQLQDPTQKFQDPTQNSQDPAQKSQDPVAAVPAHQDELADVLDPQFYTGYQTELFGKALLGPQPRLIHKFDFSRIGGLTVVGHRMKKHYLSHSLQDLKQHLHSDTKIQQAFSTLTTFLADSLRDIQEFCLNHAWLTEIHIFVHSWSHAQKEAMHGWASRQYEEHINQLQVWIRRVKNVRKSFLTQNRLLSVICSCINDDIVTLLVSITEDILSLLTSECRHRTTLILEELGNVVKVLETINTDIPTVSQCARKVEKYKTLIPDLQQKIDYIRSLSEVIRMHYRQLTTEEESLENTMLDTWETFQRLLKEASEFISSKLPIIESNLKQSFLAFRSEMLSLIVTSTTGHFLDPSQSVPAVLKELGDLQKKLQSLISTLNSLSYSRLTLKGKPFDLSFISPGEKRVTFRQEIWKLFQRVTEQLNTWKSLPFSKFHPEGARQKLAAWQRALLSMQESLPAGDPVFHACKQLVLDFGHYLPVLEMLASPVLKQKHWNAIYAVMGEEDPGDVQSTLSDLLALPLRPNSDAIAKIWCGAMAEMSCLQTLQKLKATWEEQHFRLAKFLLNIRRRDPSPDPSRRPSSGRFREPEEGLFSKDTGTFILIDTEKLRLLLEDSLMTLQMLHYSPNAASLWPEVEVWTATLQDIELFLELWITFQQKWIFLNKVLHEMDVPFPRSEMVPNFEMVDRSYRAFIQTTCQDSLVLSILAHGQSRRDWAFRGEPLKATLSDGITVMEGIIRELQDLLEATRASCPRLYFLSDDEVIAFLTASVEATHRVTWAKRCFRNVQDVEFESRETDNSSSAFALYAPRAIAKAIIGYHGERVSLYSPVKGDLKATVWLCHFEHSMKESLSLLLRGCLAERMSMKEKLEAVYGSRPGSTTSSAKDPELHMAGELWRKLASTFPFQCILLAEEVSWWSEVEETLFTTPAKMATLKHKQRLKIEGLVKYTQRYRRSLAPPDSLLLALLSALILHSVHHRDTISSLLQHRVETKASFEWAKLFKYRMNVHLPDGTGLEPRSSAFEDELTQKQETDCYLEVLDGRLPYDYEYTGPNSMHMGSTSTEKSLLGLILAIQEYYCASLISHEGVTKMETILTLANALGRHIVVLTCSEQTGLQCITQNLSGAVQAGAWLLLETADRLSQGILGMISQPLADLRKACVAMMQAKDPSHYSNKETAGYEWQEEQEANAVRTQDAHKKIAERANDNASPRKLSVIGSINFNGNLISVRQSYGCFMTLSQCNPAKNIPTDLSMVMRPVSVVYPNIKRMAEGSMLAAGFQEATHLAAKMNSFFELAQKLGSVHHSSCHQMVRSIIIASVACLDKHSASCRSASCLSHQSGSVAWKSVASLHEDVETLADEAEGEQLCTPSTEVHLLVLDRRRSNALFSVNLGLEEERALIRALLASPLFSAPASPELSNLKELLRNVFPMSVSLLSEEVYLPRLGSAVNSELQESKLHANPDLTGTMLQLYQALLQTRGVIVMGSPGSGKTTSWKILARALNRLASNDCQSIKYVEEEEQETESVIPSSECYGPVTSECFYPSSLTTEEFLGRWENGKWNDGLFAKLLRTSGTVPLTHLDSARKAHKVQTCLRSSMYDPQKWVVLDGLPKSELLDQVSCLLGPHPFLSLPNSEQIGTPTSMKFIFEVTDLANISPSLSTQCSLVYYRGDQTWRAVLAACLSSLCIRYSVTQNTADMIRSLSQDLFPATLSFLGQTCSPVLEPHAHLATTGLGSVANGLQEITSFQKIFQVLLDLHLCRDKTQIPTWKDPMAGGHDLNTSATGSVFTKQRQRLEELNPDEHDSVVQHSFLYAYIWGFGGHLHLRHWSQFDAFVREALLRSHCQVELPLASSIFDLYLDPVVGSLKTFDGSHLKGHILANCTALPQYESLFYLMDLLLGSSHPVLLAGETGSGKSSFMKMLLNHSHIYHRIPLSTCPTATHLRQLLASKVPQGKRAGIHLSPLHEIQMTSLRGLPTRYLLLLEDLHAASPAAGKESLPILEVLRQALAEHASQSAESLQLGHYLNPQGLNYIATISTPADPACPISPRFTRLFTVVSLPTATRESLISIFTPRTEKWLQQAPSLARPAETAAALVSATINIYLSTKRAFRPSPSHSHYLFSLHDIEKLFKGLFLLSPQIVILLSNAVEGSKLLSSQPIPEEYSPSTLNARVLARLWLHESLRTYCDRLLTEEEKAQFVEILAAVAESSFCTKDAIRKLSFKELETVGDMSSGQTWESDGHELFPPNPQGDPIASHDLHYRKDETVISETPGQKSQEQEGKPGQETEGNTVTDEYRVMVDPTITFDAFNVFCLGDSGRLSSNTTTSAEEDESESQEETEFDDTTSDTDTLPSVVQNNRSKAIVPLSSSVDEPKSLSSAPGHSIATKTKGKEGEHAIGTAKTKPTLQPSPPPQSARSQGAGSSVKRHRTLRRRRRTASSKKRNGTQQAITVTGPLLPPNLLRGPEEKLQDLIFSMATFPTNSSVAGTQAYQECKPETLANQLYTQLNKTHSEKSIGQELVFSKEVLQHLTRLLRILITPHGHSILMAMSLGTGRRLLVSLAAKLTQSMLFEVPDHATDAEINTLIREAIWNAGILSKSTTLLVHERAGAHNLQKLLAVMSEGTFQGLYLPEDIEDLFQGFLKANKNIKKTINPEVVFERFHQMVKNKLHVVILIESTGEKAFSSPMIGLLKLASSVDVYHSWSEETLMEVASHQLRMAISCTNPQGPRSALMMEVQSLLPCICRLLTQIHLLAVKYAGHLSPCLPLLTPKTFLDFIDIFLILMTQLQEANRAHLNRMKKAVSRTDEVKDEVERYRTEVAEVTEKQQKAAEQTRNIRKRMEEERASLDRIIRECQYHETTHERLLCQLETLQNERKTSLHQIAQEYYAIAGKLTVYDIEEIRSYRAPPHPVILVTDVLCMMFGRDPGWESAKLLIGKEDFYEDLEFYDKDHMSDEMYEALGQVISEGHFNPANFQTASVATASLCDWIRAVYTYSHRMRQLHPKVLQLQQFEAKVNKEEVKLSKAIHLQELLKQKVEVSSTSYQKAVAEEDQLTQELNKLVERKNEAEHFQETISAHSFDWETTLKVLEDHSRTIPGDALILAAFTCYLGPFSLKQREELMEKWQRLCRGWDVSLPPDDLSRELEKCLYVPSCPAPTNCPLPIREDFSCIDLLSSASEKRVWYQTMPCEQPAGQSLALSIRTSARYSCRHWPLLVDPDKQGEGWIRLIHKRVLQTPSVETVDGHPAPEAHGSNLPTPMLDPKEDHQKLCVLPASDPDIDEKLRAASSEGAAILVTHIERGCSSPVLQALLRKESCSSQVSPTFQLYISTSLPFDAIEKVLDSALLKNLSVFYMGISETDLEELVLVEILNSEKPELQSERRGLALSVQQVDDELRQIQDSLLEEVIQANEPLLQKHDFLPMVHRCQKKVAVLLSNLQDLVALQQQQEESLDEYRKCARLGAGLYSTIQEVSYLHKIYSFHFRTFLSLVKNVLLSKKRSEVVKREVLQTRVLDLMNSLSSCILSYIRRCLTESHAKIFHFLVAAVQMRLVGQLTNLEWLVFLHGLKDINVGQSLSESPIARPQWVSADAWTECSRLEILPAFRYLRSSLVYRSCQWQEYFALSSSVIGPIPCASHARLTLIEKAILWRTLRPDKLLNVISDLTMCILGQSLTEDPENDIDSKDSHNCTSVPVVFVMPGPELGGPSTHPLYSIEQMAITQGHEDKLRVLSFGSPDSEAELPKAFQKGKAKGHWLVLNNCHLLDHWGQEATSHLRELLETCGMLPKNPQILEGPDSRLQQAPAEDSRSKVHPDFRLWIIVDGDATQSLPAFLKQQAMKVFCDTPLELRSTLKRSFTQGTRQLSSQAPVQHILVLVLLHAVLLHRQHYRGLAEAEVYHWTQADLFAALSVLERVWNLCDDLEEAMVFLAGSVIYGGHVLNPGDEAAVLGVARQCLDTSSRLLPVRGVHSLLSALTCRSLAGTQVTESWIQETQRRIQQLPVSADPVIFGLSEGMAEKINTRRSQELLADLQRSQGVWKPCPPAVPQADSVKTLLSDCVARLKDMALAVNRVGERDSGSRERPLHRFLLDECRLFTGMISRLLTDLCCFQDQLLGDPCLCSRCDDLARGLAQGTVPSSWSMYTKDQSPQTLLQWLQHLQRRQQLLVEYMEPDPHSILYNLSAFHCPKRLLVAVMQERAQNESQDLDHYSIEAQVMQRSVRPKSALQHGLYLTGLEVRNALWDTRLSILQETLSSKPCSIPEVWIRAVRTSTQECGTSSVFPKYLCPLYVGTAGDEVIRAQEQVVMFLPLTSKMDPSVCSQRHVHAVSVL
ncbi:dynein heavy chain domain-containing protein 1 isoform X2 [Lissotriton helveticus]